MAKQVTVTRRTGKVLEDLTPKKPDTSVKPDTLTTAFAALLSSDTVLVDHAVKIVDADETRARGPVEHLFDIYRVAGIKFNRDAMLKGETFLTGNLDKLSELPIPDSVDKADPKHPEYVVSPNNYDRKLSGKRGKGAKVFSKYEKIISETSYGLAYLTEASAAKRAMDAGVGRKTDPGVLDKFRSWVPRELDNEHRRQKSKFNGSVKLLKKAVSVHLQMSAMAQLTKLRCFYLTNPDGEVRHTLEPITIVPHDNADDYENFTVSRFLGLNPDVAFANGGTMETLTATLKKGADEAGTGDDPDVAVIDSLDKADEYIAEFAAFVEKPLSGKLWEYLNKKNNENEYINGSTILSLKAMHAWLDNQFMPKFKPVIRILENKEAEKAADTAA